MRKIISFLLIGMILTSFSSSYATEFYYGILSEEERTLLIGGCKESDITDLIIPETITVDSKSYTVVSVFNYGQSFYNGESIVSITFPSTIREIGNNTFSHCTTLESIKFSNSRTNVAFGAFAECSSLRNVDIGKSSLQLQNGAFQGCSALKEIDLSRMNVDEITGFSGCTSLEKVILPANLERIGHRCFQNCKSLKEICIPQSVFEISDMAFSGCESLEQIDLSLCRVSDIRTKTFMECSSLVSIKFPQSLYSIGEGAFVECGFKDVILPESLTTLGNNAFSDCKNLRSIQIPMSLDDYGSYIFSECTNLRTIKTENPKILSELSNFVDDCMITKIDLMGSSDYIVEDNILFDKSKKNVLFAYRNIDNIELPNTVITINPGAFRHCEGLESITLPPSLKTIGREAFRYTGLKDIKIPNSVTTIEEGVFSWCHNLSSVSLPDNLATIEPFTFYESGLTSIIIPATVKTMGRSAFGGESPALDTIVCCAIEPPVIEFDSFEGVRAATKVYVPSGCVNAYANDDRWGFFFNIKEIETETGVCDITQERDVTTYYDLRGIQYSGIHPGFKIKRNGTTFEKIMQ